MTTQNGIQELKVLQVIAETLNRCNDLEHMLQTVLEKLLSVTGLETGWVFLIEEEPQYVLAADHRLPPALSREQKQPMCSGNCYCLTRFWNNKLPEPINIIECKRLEEARVEKRWDTRGITHHATIPLVAGDERFGVLNVAAKHQESFTETELTHFQSVALQIGTAIKRTKLYYAQQKRAQLFEKLNNLTPPLWNAEDKESLIRKVIETLREQFPNQSFNLYKWKQGKLSSLRDGRTLNSPMALRALEDEDVLIEGSTMVIPLYSKDHPFGLLIMTARHSCDEVDREFGQALAVQIQLAYENIYIQEKQRELLLHEERNRLARDLHDSVNQKLFTLNLIAKGLAAYISEEGQPYVDDLSQLSRESLKEMRTLIWQLRPFGREEGMVASIRKYASNLGIQIEFHLSCSPNWTNSMEETLWRIAQEALNNIHKHASVNQAFVSFYLKEGKVYMEVKDYGEGFDPNLNEASHGFGLTSMRERAHQFGGSVWIESEVGKGTTLTASLPQRKKAE